MMGMYHSILPGIDARSIILNIRGERYFLGLGTTSLGGLRTQVVAFLYDYQAYFRARECIARTAMNLLLDTLDQDLELNEVCAWVVQLSCDLRITETREDVTEIELREYLKELIKKCRTTEFK